MRNLDDEVNRNYHLNSNTDLYEHTCITARQRSRSTFDINTNKHTESQGYVPFRTLETI